MAEIDVQAIRQQASRVDDGFGSGREHLNDLSEAVFPLCDAYEAQAKEIERLKAHIAAEGGQSGTVIDIDGRKVAVSMTTAAYIERLKGLLREAQSQFDRFGKAGAEINLPEHDGYFTVNLGVMNGNVTQQVIHWKLEVSDFWNARSLSAKLAKELEP